MPVKIFIKNFSYYIIIFIFAATIKILTKNYQTMKKLFFSVCAASLLLFSACSKDDDKDVSEMSSAEISSMIVGTWQITQYEWSYQMDGEKDSGVDKFYEGEYTWIFNNDNTWIIRMLDIDDEDNDGEDNDIIYSTLEYRK